MKVVITGANFGNKGAQSMLFTTVAVLRRNYPDAKIFFAHGNKTPVLKEDFLFDEVYLSNTVLQVPFGSDNVTPPQNQLRMSLGIHRKKH